MPQATGNLTAVPTVSPLHNLTTGGIVDRLGALKAQIADLVPYSAWLLGHLT